MALDIGEPRIPVTIVTGFLGSGKTTLVNHILARNDGVRIGVMVNEFGEIAIDPDLVIGAADDLIELANGCICCSINDDLVQGLVHLLSRERRIDYLVVETTGIADPLPVTLTFMRPEFRNIVRVDAIVALADAENFNLDRFARKAALNQLRFADFVLLNKCDLASPERVDAVENQIRGLSPAARIIRVNRARIALSLILGIGAFQSQATVDEAGHSDTHLEDDGVEAVSFASAYSFSAEKFQAFLESLPANVFRAKGILAIEGSTTRYLFHLVGGRFTLDEARALAGPNRLVLIGQKLDAVQLRTALEACIASPATRAPG